MVQSFLHWLYPCSCKHSVDFIQQWQILALIYEINSYYELWKSPEVKKKWRIIALNVFDFCPLLEECHSRPVLFSPVFLSHNFRLFCRMSLKEFLCPSCESLPSIFWLHRMHIGIVLSFTQTVCPLQWHYVFISMVWQKLFLNMVWHWILYFTFIYIMNLNWMWITCQD